MKSISPSIIYTFNYLFIFYYCFPNSIFNVAAICSKVLINRTTDRLIIDNIENDSSVISKKCYAKRRTQRIMEELTEACQQNSMCSARSIPLPFDRLACIRKCVSPNCYASVYLDQPLEPGEIDVKYSKYKACFHRHWRSRYANTYSHLNEL